MRGTFLAAYLGLSCCGAELAVTCDSDPCLVRTYREFLTPIFDVVYPCGGIAPTEELQHNAHAYKMCADMCEKSGRDYALTHGCYNFSQAIDHGIFNDGRVGCEAIYNAVIEGLDGTTDLPQNFTVSECAMRCEESSDCFYWEYSPAIDFYGGSIDGTPDPNHPDWPWNTKVKCRLVSLEVFKSCGSDYPGHGTCRFYFERENKTTWRFFERTYPVASMYEARFMSSTSTISGFSNYNSFDENCQMLSPFESKAARLSRDLSETNAESISSTANDCAARITAVQPQWVEDCRNKCSIFGPGGSLHGYCEHSNADVSSLIGCIANLTSYCMEKAD